MQNSSTLKRRRIDQIFYFLPQFLLAMKLQSQAETNVGMSVDHTCSFWGDARRRAYCTRASCGGGGCFTTLPFEDSPVDDSKGAQSTPCSSFSFTPRVLVRALLYCVAPRGSYTSFMSDREVRALLLFRITRFLYSFHCLIVRSAHSSCVGSQGSCTPFIV